MPMQHGVLRTSAGTIRRRTTGVKLRGLRQFRHPRAMRWPLRKLGREQRDRHAASIQRVDPFGVPSRYRSRFTRAPSSSRPSSVTACAASITHAIGGAHRAWGEAALATCLPQGEGDLDVKVLVDFELHPPTTRSAMMRSRASSAAYATAAETSSRVKEG
jgi:hypothetical protein